MDPEVDFTPDEHGSWNVFLSFIRGVNEELWRGPNGIEIPVPILDYDLIAMLAKLVSIFGIRDEETVDHLGYLISRMRDRDIKSALRFILGATPYFRNVWLLHETSVHPIGNGDAQDIFSIPGFMECAKDWLWLNRNCTGNVRRRYLSPEGLLFRAFRSHDPFEDMEDLGRQFRRAKRCGDINHYDIERLTNIPLDLNLLNDE